jgi:hypothetical protein
VIGLVPRKGLGAGARPATPGAGVLPGEHPKPKAQSRTFNIQHSTSNIQHPTFNIQHSTSNIQHSTSNIQHPTSNIQHPTPNAEQRVMAV